jgi:hypothetical protein
MKKHKLCFQGYDAVSWLCEQLKITRQEAVSLGEFMQLNGYIASVGGDSQPFADEDFLFRFTPKTAALRTNRKASQNQEAMAVAASVHRTTTSSPNSSSSNINIVSSSPTLRSSNNTADLLGTTSESLSDEEFTDNDSTSGSYSESSQVVNPLSTSGGSYSSSSSYTGSQSSSWRRSIIMGSAISQTNEANSFSSSNGFPKPTALHLLLPHLLLLLQDG